MTALLFLLQSPLEWAFIIAAAVMTATAGGTAEPHTHYFRRHPSGVWRCTGCPATRDRNGKATP